MKSLLLVRHAKSDWDDPSLKDFDRPLNDRGKRDAPLMAHRLLDKKVKIDAFISSPAKRARKTAELFSEEYKENKKHIIFFDELYLADPQVFSNVIAKTSNKHDNIAVFSHNPGITDFANQLTEVKIDEIPTCSIFAVRLDIKKWSDFKDAEREFWFFDSPKSV
jgi:phosphohistidine phosphatase